MPVSFLVGRARETDSILFNPLEEMNASGAICVLCKYEVCKSDNKAVGVLASSLEEPLFNLALNTIQWFFLVSIGQGPPDSKSD